MATQAPDTFIIDTPITDTSTSDTPTPDNPTTITLIDHPNNRPDTPDVLDPFESPDLLDKADRESPTIPYPVMDITKTFSSLPPEMREAIWKAVSPSGHDAVMGPYRISDGDTIDHGAFSSILCNPDIRVATLVCRAAFDAWANASVGKLYMSLYDEALDSLKDLRFNVNSIITLLPRTFKLKQLFNTLLRRHERGYKPVKTVYIGISAVVCEAEVSPIANDQLGESKFRLFGINDPSLPDFLDTCNAPRRFHHTKECYITSIQEFWAQNRTPKQMRQVWAECISSNNNLITPELKPVIVATESADEIEYRADVGWRSEMKVEKLAWSVQTTGGDTTEWFDNWSIHLGHRLLRQARCQKCWPEDTGYYEMLGANSPSQEALEDGTE